MKDTTAEILAGAAFYALIFFIIFTLGVLS